ncbi:MAG: metalloregulator ArsR/SmtB family transcription factor [Anaerolineales bacterium]|jgi:DNA-binding transcriptional ArsR family regulator
MERNENMAIRCANFYAVLANPRRLMILWALEGGEMCVGDLAESIGASLPCTSQHLRMMRENGLLESRRDGQTIYYGMPETLDTSALHRSCEACAEALGETMLRAGSRIERR